MLKKDYELGIQIRDKLIAEQQNGDIEIAHCNADDYLCELLMKLGFTEVVNEYENIEK
jgi:hypothetical protein